MYSKTLEDWSVTRSPTECKANVLLTAPRAVDHVPPKDTDTHDILVEEVHDPKEIDISHDLDLVHMQDSHVSVTCIRPVPVNEQQPLEETEL